MRLTLILPAALLSASAPRPAGAFECEDESKSEVVGLAPGGGAYAQRTLRLPPDPDDACSPCGYPKANGACHNGVTLELCRPGAEKCEKSWTIYAAAEGDDDSRCTSQTDAREALAKAKRAFAEAGVDLEVEPEALSKVKGEDAGYRLPVEVTRPLGIDAPVTIRHAHREMKEEAGVVMVFEAEAEGFGKATFAREECFSYCFGLPEVMQSATDGGVVFNLMNVPCGHGVTDAVATRTIASRLLNLRGLKHHERKSFEASARDFGRAFTLDPSWGQAAFNLACAHARRGQKGAAIEALRKAVELQPKIFRRKARKDHDLDSLRGDATFDQLVSGGG